MDNTIFISQEISWAIASYLSTKEQPLTSSLPFHVIVIRTLITIYGELDIVNPYITKNEKNLGGFDDNLTKYGFKLEDLNKFKNDFTTYIKLSREQGNIEKLFTEIEKSLILMFCYKNYTMHLKDEEITEFKKYIALSTSPLLQDYINIYVKDKTFLDRFFYSKLFLSNHKLNISLLNRQTLTIDAYLLLGYTESQIKEMSDKELNEVNNQVYNFFKIPLNEPNKNDLLIKAVNYYKKYGNRLTTGNGYVDMLLLMSVISTIIFIATIFAFKFF